MTNCSNSDSAAAASSASRRRVLQLIGAAAVGLSGGLSGGLGSGRGANAAGTRAPATARAPGPLPGMVGEEELTIDTLDIEATQANGELVGRLLGPVEVWGAKSPQGVKILIPPGQFSAEFNLRTDANNHFAPGGQVILQGIRENGRRPIFGQPGARAGVGLSLHDRHDDGANRIGFQMRDLEWYGGLQVGWPTLYAWRMRYVGLQRSRINGGKNGIFMPIWPAFLRVEDSEIDHGGKGDGLTHNVYLNYVENATFLRSRLHSPRAEGHTLKCYAAGVRIEECDISTAGSRADIEAGYFGDLSPIDIGARSQTTIVRNRITRRGPVSGGRAMIDIRNRQYRKGFTGLVPPDWGTAEVPYQAVDNRDPTNPNVYRHLVAFNVFNNGLDEDGAIDPGTEKRKYYGVRNNGTWSGLGGGHREIVLNGERQVLQGDQDIAAPDDFQLHHQRAVVFVHANQYAGHPLTERLRRQSYSGKEEFQMPTPIIELASLPDWARERLDNA